MIMLKKLAFRLKKDTPMPTLRALLLVRELEAHGRLLEVAPDVQGSGEIQPGDLLTVRMETECPSEELERLLANEFVSQLEIHTEEAGDSDRSSASPPSPDLKALVESLAETLVLAQPGDAESDEAIRPLIEEIERWLRRSGHEQGASLAREALSHLGMLPDSRDSGWEPAWGSLNESVIRLQALSRQLLLEARASGGGEDEEAPSPAESAPGGGSAFSENAELLACFVSESMEHLENADVQLLTVETDPGNADALNAVFRAFHTIKGSAAMMGLSVLSGLAHEAENLLVMAREGKLALCGPAVDAVFDTIDRLKQLVRDPLSATEGDSAEDIQASVAGLIARIKDVSSGNIPLTEEPAASRSAPGKKIGEALVEAGLTTQNSVEEALVDQSRSPSHPKIGELLVRSGQVAAKDVALTLREQGAGGSAQGMQVRETVKVDADRLDALIDAIGELVIAESMVFQSDELNRAASPALLRHLGLLDKITRELQEMGTSLRMIPVKATFQKMARLVRDLSRKSGKKVELFTSGEDTELDKTVVDQIGDPLIHMIRNSVDHGIESNPEDRLQAGKPEVGRVDLHAYHKGGSIYIEVQDDGRGLDRQAILSKAIERGLVKETDSLTDREILNLIFLPGFSTAKKVSDVSGRGVGMDVVRRNVEALRGQVEILSEPGMGSIFSIRLPLTLAIIDGMVVRVASERYIIPTLSIVQSLRPKREDLQTVLQKGEMLKVHGRLMPLFRLDRLFAISGGQQEAVSGTIVVVEDSGRQTGIVVDEILGQQQIVIKPLGELLQGTPGVSGGAIMPDGRVGLILDVASLVRMATSGDDSDIEDGGREAQAAA
jgi:two-component system chemotaxis sensor kinase CheA